MTRTWPGAAATGDRQAFAGIYDRYADRLHDFCVFGMLRDRDAAADCVQDVFCSAATDLAKLREPDKLRPWLYSIARNQALARRINARRREQVSDEAPEVASSEAGPDTLAGRNELAQLIAEAAGGLSDRDRTVLELALSPRAGRAQLAEALGVSANNANVMVHRPRETIERSLGALLVSRRARTNPHSCRELAAVLAGWDGRFTILMRKTHRPPHRVVPGVRADYAVAWSTRRRCSARRRWSSRPRTGSATRRWTGFSSLFVRHPDGRRWRRRPRPPRTSGTTARSRGTAGLGRRGSEASTEAECRLDRRHSARGIARHGRLAVLAAHPGQSERCVI